MKYLEHSRLAGSYPPQNSQMCLLTDMLNHRIMSYLLHLHVNGIAIVYMYIYLHIHI